MRWRRSQELLTKQKGNVMAKKRLTNQELEKVLREKWKKIDQISRARRARFEAARKKGSIEALADFVNTLPRF